MWIGISQEFIVQFGPQRLGHMRQQVDQFQSRFTLRMFQQAGEPQL